MLSCVREREEAVRWAGPLAQESYQIPKGFIISEIILYRNRPEGLNCNDRQTRRLRKYNLIERTLNRKNNYDVPFRFYCQNKLFHRNREGKILL